MNDKFLSQSERYDPGEKTNREEEGEGKGEGLIRRRFMVYRVGEVRSSRSSLQWKRPSEGTKKWIKANEY